VPFSKVKGLKFYQNFGKRVWYTEFSANDNCKVVQISPEIIFQGVKGKGFSEVRVIDNLDVPKPVIWVMNLPEDKIKYIEPLM